MFITNGYWEFQLVGSYANHLKPISPTARSSFQFTKQEKFKTPPKKCLICTHNGYPDSTQLKSQVLRSPLKG